MNIHPDHLNDRFNRLQFKTHTEEKFQSQTLTNLNLLWEIEKQSPFTGIDNATLFDGKVSLTILGGQVNTKPGMFSFFKIHSPVTGFGFFFHLTSPSQKPVFPCNHIASLSKLPCIH